MYFDTYSTDPTDDNPDHDPTNDVAFVDDGNLYLGREGYFASNKVNRLRGEWTLNGGTILTNAPSDGVFANSNGTWIAIQNARVAVTAPLTISASTNGHIVTYTVGMPTNAVHWTYGTQGTNLVCQFTAPNGTNYYLPYAPAP
jgi:hypothetical protein